MNLERMPSVDDADIAAADGTEVARVLDAYLAAIEAGQSEDPDRLLAEHPAIAEELRGHLEIMRLARRLEADLGPGPGASDRGDDLLGLGDYRIVRELGRGGMGVVYEAEQVSLGRRVALKVLPTLAALVPRRLQRFRVEAQAAAHLHHPHIVPVFAVGCERGVHYYAMQLIEGRTLAAIIREQRSVVDGEAETAEWGAAAADSFRTGPVKPGTGSAPAADPGPGSNSPRDGASSTSATGLSDRGRLRFRAVARLGMQAAGALDHAHGLGILHRDIKPANLMVDGRGDVWITDFGLARLQGDSDLTQTGDLLGTLRYMSPEQATARQVVVDHRTDIYSLGVTLYELLTSRPAFDGGERQELLRRVATEEPTPPRRLDPTIPRDLETIVLKAMAKEPDGRYASAQELAEDLGRFLDDTPIRARRPGPLERLSRWSRRHRPAVASAVTALVVTMAVATVLLGIERSRTADALKQSLLEKKRAEEALREKREILRRTASYSEHVLLNAMGKLSALGAVGPKDAGFYRMAADYFGDVARQTESDPQMLEVTAMAEHRRGFSLMLVADPLADESYLRAIALYGKLAAGSPAAPEPRKGLAYVLWDRGTLLMATGRLGEAEALFRRSQAIRKALATEFPDDRAALSEFARTQVGLAAMIDGFGRPRDAEAARREVSDLFDALAADRAAPPDRRRLLAWAYRELADALGSFGRAAESAQALDRASKLEREAAPRG
jgi:serine/threonine protein kinase